MTETSSRHQFVPRHTLFDRLSLAAGGGVTLLSAAAGSGKTELIRGWLADSGLAHRTAWVSVERGERDPRRFWQTMLSEVLSVTGDERPFREARPSPQWRGDEALRQVLGALEAHHEQVIVVIDDLHELQSMEASDLLERLLSEAPDYVRVILSSRHDPLLGLHRLRVSDRLTELRGADLRFAETEARLLLKAAGVKLSDRAFGVLLQRTEGWAAGLRLAAISLNGHPDPERFVFEFSGSERTVADYLFAEVLDRQDIEVRRLLVRTSILNKVNGALGDLLSGTTGSERVLQDLERAGSFVAAVDAGRYWFRYHRLFADLLRLELRRTAPDSEAELHRTAAQWHAGHGSVVDAITHAQAAEDWPFAARLLADHHHTLMLDGDGATARTLLSAFPGDVPGANADLAQVAALNEVVLGSVDAALMHMEIAERLVEDLHPDHRDGAGLQLWLLRLSVARRLGDFHGVLDMAPSLDAADSPRTSSNVGFSNEARALALMYLGAAEWWSMRPADAERHLVDGIELAHRIDQPWVEVACLGNLAFVALSRAPAQAPAHAQASIDLAEANGWLEEAVAAPALLSRATIATWHARFDEADDWLRQAEVALVSAADPVTTLQLLHGRVLVRLGQRRLNEAAQEIAEQRRLLEHLIKPSALLVFWAALLEARVQGLSGRLGEAREVLAEVDASYHGRAEYLVTAALLSAEGGDPEDVLQILAPVVKGTAPAMEPVARVEGHLLAARLHRDSGAVSDARVMVEAALRHAERFGLVMPFLTEPAANLVEQHPRHLTKHGAFIDLIRSALSGRVADPVTATPLLEHLSDSELRVLGYLASNLSVPEIARELYLSTNTVKTHTRHIYSKLTVNSRTAAVSRARAHGLLAPR